MELLKELGKLRCFYCGEDRYIKIKSVLIQRRVLDGEKRYETVFMIKDIKIMEFGNHRNVLGENTGVAINLFCEGCGKTSVFNVYEDKSFFSTVQTAITEKHY